jgi:hypothetical protein
VRLEQPRAQLEQWGVPQRAPWVMWEPLARLAQWARLVPMETREQLANRPWWGARLARQEQPPVRLVQWVVPQRAPWVLWEPLAPLGQWGRLVPMETRERLANRPWLELWAQLEQTVPPEHGALSGPRARLGQLAPRVLPERQGPMERPGQREQQGRQGPWVQPAPSVRLGQPVLQGRLGRREQAGQRVLEGRLAPLEQEGRQGPLEQPAP